MGILHVSVWLHIRNVVCIVSVMFYALYTSSIWASQLLSGQSPKSHHSQSPYTEPKAFLSGVCICLHWVTPTVQKLHVWVTWRLILKCGCGRLCPPIDCLVECFPSVCAGDTKQVRWWMNIFTLYACIRLSLMNPKQTCGSENQNSCFKAAKTECQSGDRYDWSLPSSHIVAICGRGCRLNRPNLEGERIGAIHFRDRLIWTHTQTIQS